MEGPHEKVNKSVQEPQNISHAEGAETLYFLISKHKFKIPKTTAAFRKD